MTLISDFTDSRDWSFDAARQTTPLFEPSLMRALRKVSRGEVGAFSLTDPLGPRTDGLVPPRLLSALFILCRDGMITVGPADPRDGWRVAELTDDGAALLADWTARLTDYIPHQMQDIGVVRDIRHFVETEDGVPRELSTPDGPVWIAVCRATVRIGDGRPGGLSLCERCAELTRVSAR